MNMEEIFIPDSNVFITASRMYYQHEIAPIFWEQMSKYICNGRIVILDCVFNEICNAPNIKDQNSEDWLSSWLKKCAIDKIYKTNASDDIVKAYSDVLNHLNKSPYYTQTGKRAWSEIKIADPWIIATAVVTGYTVISLEKKIQLIDGVSIANPKIPNFCEDFNVKYFDTFYMMKELEIVL
jgi:hypothetical protein